MPIRPPNLDDRRYADILREARALIPQYAPEWTNVSDADPGMTLVQLFAWMTEMIIYRLNQVPDKTYIHFLNFIGEERKPARPAVAPVTFTLKGDKAVEIPPFTRCATRQREDSTAADYITTDGVTVHGASIVRVMAVRGGSRRAVREVPFALLHDNKSALQFAGGRGVDLFDLDPIEFGPESYTPEQYFYIGHRDFRIMGLEGEEGRRQGRLRIRRSAKGGDALSVADLFVWEYPTAEGWTPVGADVEPETTLGMVETSLVTTLPEIAELRSFATSPDDIKFPDTIVEERWWIRGRLEYERWLAARMIEDLDVYWQDDRGGEKHAVQNWSVRATGRYLEFSLQDLPPILGGWTVRFELADRRLSARKTKYLPRYRWYYRRGEGWEEVPKVRSQGTEMLLEGPFPDMAPEGINLRAERIEALQFGVLMPDFDIDVTWIRPIELDMYCGDDVRRLDPLLIDEGPWSPFQLAAQVPPTIGRKWFLGSDLFENRRQSKVIVEIDVAFEMNGTAIPEPGELYLLQLTYRADDNWRVVWSEDRVYSSFTFALLDPEGAKVAGKRTIRIELDPKTQLKGLARHEVSGRETTWIRIEMVKASLTGVDEKKVQHPIVPKIYDVRLGVEGAVGAREYEQPLPNPRTAQLDLRGQNRRFTRVLATAMGRASEHFPFFPFVETQEENQALYFQFDQPLPPGRKHSVTFRTRGESSMPTGVRMEWEILEAREHNRPGWRRLHAPGEGAETAYNLTGTGTLTFGLPETPALVEDGFWLRARLSLPAGVTLDMVPTLPPIVHILLNTVDVVNLVTVRTERFSGLGVPNQTLQLRRVPIFLHQAEGERPLFKNLEAFPDIRVFVENDDGTIDVWTRVSDGALLTAGKDDRIFVIDAVDGTLTFGNGIRGRMLPVGSSNIVIDTYRYVPGSKGNVAAREISLVEGVADSVRCENLLPASGGRDAETIDEILRRAPSLLTSRDRAVTRHDFAVIATEASGEVARASCEGNIGPDGKVEVVILPRRREGEKFPDAMLATGLRDNVQRHLKQRSLINVIPVVRLSEFMHIDVSVTVRLRPNANTLAVREAAARWIDRFLDPYEGGLDNTGWPFQATLYAQDFGRLVSDIPEVRHVVHVALFEMTAEKRRRQTAGWEEGEGTDRLFLTAHDLFAVRRVRVKVEELGE